MGGSGNVFKVSKDAWSTVNRRLLFICAVYSMGHIFFGYDGASFAGVQAFTPFVTRFGKSSSTGTYSLPAKLASIMNSLPLIGKLIGTIIVSPITERLGHKKTLILTCLIQALGVIVQCTSKIAAQFTAGRVIIYVAVGLVENVVPTYETEVSPAPLRGFFVGSLQLFLTFGSLIAGIVNQACSKYKTDAGWHIATAIQVVPAAIILAFVWWTPDSPRWLLSRGKKDEALATLRKLRTQADVDAGIPEMELRAWEEAKEATTGKGAWLELFQGTNLRRTMIACFMMSLQQLTGVTFSSSYGPTFYKRVGLASMAFTYAAINNAVSVVTALIGMVLLDLFGRRDVVLWGNVGQAFFLMMIGGLGSKIHRTTGETNTMVASFILYAAILHASLGPAAYITSGEVGTARLREKTMAVSTAINVVVSFAVVYSSPYLIASIAAKTAYIWGGCAAAGAVMTWFILPELKGRSLEECDEIFEARIPAWRFKTFKTTGINHIIGEIERGHIHDLGGLQGGKIDSRGTRQDDKNEEEKLEDSDSKTTR